MDLRRLRHGILHQSSSQAMPLPTDSSSNDAQRDFIHLSSQDVQQDIIDIAAAGNQHSLSIRYGSFDGPEPVKWQGFDIKAKDLDDEPDASNKTTEQCNLRQQSKRYTSEVYENVRAWPEPKDGSEYLLASYTKTLVNVLMFIVLKEERRKGGLNIDLDTDACRVYNSVRTRHPYLRLKELRLRSAPTLRELLAHRKGFPPMNHILYAPDGSGLLGADEFIEVAGEEAARFYQKAGNEKKRFMYSNANHIFAAIIIECIAGKSFRDAMQEHLFGPLKMERSSFGREDGVHTGYMVSSTNNAYEILRKLSPNNVVECAPLGLRSHPNDIATFNTDLLMALVGDRAGKLLSHDEAKDLMAGNEMTLFGFTKSAHLGQSIFQVDTRESPNIHLASPSHDSCNAILSGPDDDKNSGQVCCFHIHHKSGYYDGSSCKVFLIPGMKLFVSIMGDTTGPLDVVHHVAWYLLQSILQVSPLVDIKSEAIQAREKCSATLKRYEEKYLVQEAQHNDPGIDWSHLSGTYRREGDEQDITINDGSIRFHRGHMTSSQMKIKMVDRHTVRVLLDGSTLSSEVWSTWANMDFTVVQNGADLALLLKTEDGEQYKYRKLAAKTK